MVQRFQCTACGKCCYGQLPLTIDDAFRHAGRFPLAIIWTPVKEVSKDFAMVAKLGTLIELPNHHKLAALVVPTAYLPATFSCPALLDNKLCGVHTEKPLRCRTMPLYPYREEQYQAELFKFPSDWACDTSEAAPVVFNNHRITFREDFDTERKALEAQHPLIQRYAEYTLKYNPKILSSLIQSAQKARGSQVVTSLSSFLTANRTPNSQAIAQQQLTVLNHYIEKTAHHKVLANFHQYYQLSAKEMSYLATRS